MKAVKIEVSDFELSLLIGLVDEQRYEYRRKARLNPVDVDSASLERSFSVLYGKLCSKKPVQASSQKS